MKSALLVIDIQNLLVEEKPYAIEERLALWQDSITKARQAGLEVSMSAIMTRNWSRGLLTGKFILLLHP